MISLSLSSFLGMQDAVVPTPVPAVPLNYYVAQVCDMFPRALRVWRNTGAPL